MPNQTHIIWLGYFYTLKLDLFNVIFIGAFNLVNNIVEKRTDIFGINPIVSLWWSVFS